MANLRAVFLVLLMVCAGAIQAAQDCPPLTGEWSNGGPYSFESLKGKVVLVYLFEARCPNCAAKWQAQINQIPKQFEKDPALLLAVSPGKTKSEVDAYIHENNVTWPVMADPNRVFEKKILELKLIPQEISLQNIMQVCVVDPSGEIHSGDWNDFAGSLRKFQKDAKWKIDPATVPDSLKRAWRAVEFGPLPLAGSLTAQALKSTDPKVKEAAQKLQTAIQPELDVLKEKEKSATQAKLAHAPTYILNDGSEIKALTSMDAGDTVMIKTGDGKMMTINKSDIKEIVKPKE